ncbi:MAG TPA: DUF1501 domain-containing protein [Ilumatobacteraceae bacterium]
MLDPDISTADAFRLLCVGGHNNDDAAALSRRRFLQMVGYGVGGGALLGTLGTTVLPQLLPGRLREAWATSPVGPNDNILVLVGMYGGNDGLNTVIPYSSPYYAQYRSNIAIPPEQVLTIDGNVGLHPNLPYLKGLYDQQEVAIIQGVGYPNPDLSHFNSMATWLQGDVSTAVLQTGWIGRWLDGLGGSDDLFKAAVIGSDLPLSFVGAAQRGIAIPDWGFDFGGGTQANDLRLYNAIKMLSSSSGGRGPWFDAMAAAEHTQIDVAQTVAPIFANDVPDGPLVRPMTVAARLINANIGLRVIDASFDNFDTHSGEPTDHGDRMTEFDAGLQAFFGTLDPQWRSRVTVMTFSEFGRTPWSNDSLGTDHGTANNHFVIGANVKGGLYGQQPSLAGLDQWDRPDFNVDFRSMYATIIDGVLGGGSSTVLGASYPPIDLFRPAGTTGAPIKAIAPTVATDFVGIVPARLLDTRLAGGATIGAASSISVHVAGYGGVPVNAVAAVLNVTAVGATMGSYLTVWPTGSDRPGTSSLNVAGPDAVPNLVIIKLGDSGQVDIYNNAGTVDCLVDVVGYFQTDDATRFTSLAPARVLDTRLGTGAPAAPIGQASSIDLQIAGQGGVDNKADSVVMNVTVTGPTSPGFVTVWPTGATMPTASNLNFVPKQTVPNLVISKLGKGKVSIYNSGGASHVVADVLGYFKSGVGDRLTAIAPARLLDTRTDGGVAKPVDKNGIILRVLGRGGVPTDGVSAVVLNVTATLATAAGFVTAYPSGSDLPLASNLNVVAGDTRANLVLAKVGPDGGVALYNSNGTVHLIADVVGYFTS